jgi:hypothetical protein
VSQWRRLRHLLPLLIVAVVVRLLQQLLLLLLAVVVLVLQCRLGLSGRLSFPAKDQALPVYLC